MKRNAGANGPGLLARGWWRRCCFFPIFWMVLTSFKTELQAIAVPPLLFFEPTLENFSLIEERTDYIGYALN